MFGFFKSQNLSSQILEDVKVYMDKRPKEEDVVRDATALSLGITMRMISRWPEEREPLQLVMLDIRERLHPDGARLLSQQFSEGARKARGNGRKSLMYGYGIMATWLIVCTQLAEFPSEKVLGELKKYQEFFDRLLGEHPHLFNDESLNQLHETFYLVKPVKKSQDLYDPIVMSR